MKRLLSLLLLILLPLVASAQAKGEHLSFMGIPLDGKVAPFIEKLKAKGLTYVGNVDNGIDLLKGTFAGYSDCKIGIYYIPQSKIVYRAIVMMQEKDRWTDVEREYFLLKHSLTKKYGDPAESVEQFAEENLNSDFLKMHAAREGQCLYKTHYKLDSGFILLVVSTTNQSVNVAIAYQDKVNGELYNQTRRDDL